LINSNIVMKERSIAKVIDIYYIAGIIPELQKQSSTFP